MLALFRNPVLESKRAISWPKTRLLIHQKTGFLPLIKGLQIKDPFHNSPGGQMAEVRLAKDDIDQQGLELRPADGEPHDRVNQERVDQQILYPITNDKEALELLA